MNNKKIPIKQQSAKNVPLDIEENPLEEFKVAPEIIEDEQPLVTAGKQGKPNSGWANIEAHKFQPGQSGNPSGRSPDLVKAIGLRIAQLKAGKILKPKELAKLERLGLDAASITVIEAIIADLATSKNPVKQQMYLERIVGKVPNINLNAEISAGMVTRFKSKLTDSELEAIANGADAMDILFDKLPDIDTGDDNVIDADSE